MSALNRYRVLAYATGFFLILLTVNIVLKYVLHAPHLGSWLAMIHGWLYLAYVLVSVDLWFRTGKRLDAVRMFGVVLAGTIPLASFVAERWVHPRVLALIEQDAETAASADGAASTA